MNNIALVTISRYAHGDKARRKDDWSLLYFVPRVGKVRSGIYLSVLFSRAKGSRGINLARLIRACGTPHEDIGVGI